MTPRPNLVTTEARPTEASVFGDQSQRSKELLKKLLRGSVSEEKEKRNEELKEKINEDVILAPQRATAPRRLFGGKRRRKQPFSRPSLLQDIKN